MKIGLNVGDGFTFNENKLTLNSDNIDLLEKNEDGFFVPSLIGKNGTSGGSIVDGYTVRDVEGAPGLNLDNVMCIFSLCAYNVINHTTSNNASPVLEINTNSVKSVRDIINELNYDIINNATYGNIAYFIKKNDLLLFKEIADQGVPCSNKPGQSIEDGNRHPSSIPLALFTVDDITYDEYNEKRCTGLKISCLWVKAGTNVASVYTKGVSYDTR